jgi:hypothetical protein
MHPRTDLHTERKKLVRIVFALLVMALVLTAVAVPATVQAANDKACWGQATKVFAKTGEMGKHASEQPTPRLGLKNLAKALADAGIIPDDSMASLGVFVATDLGLSIEACGT